MSGSKCRRESPRPGRRRRPADRQLGASPPERQPVRDPVRGAGGVAGGARWGVNPMALRPFPGKSDGMPGSPQTSPVLSGTRDVDLDAVGACMGYRVDDPNGRVGTVTGLIAGVWTDRPDAIEVRVGLFRTAGLVVPTDAVAVVHPARRRVILREAVDLDDAGLS